MRLRHIIFLGLWIGASACRLEPLLCAPCEPSGCGDTLACISGICTEPEQPDVCADFEPRCGDEPACGSGFECFEDRCQPPAEIVAGEHHSCVRWRSGRVSCWGHNRHFQSGGEKYPQLAPRVIEGLDDAMQIVATYESTCALRATGEVVCWGSDVENQLGTPGDGIRDERTPQQVSLPDPAALLAAGKSHACAMTVNRDLYCWGSGGHDGHGCLLGVPGAASSAVPWLTVPDAPYEAVVGGFYDTYGIAGGRLYGWGWGTNYELLFNGGQETCTPVELGLSDVRQIDTGGFYNCAQLGDRTVLCWGRNDFGQLANDGPDGRGGLAFEADVAVVQAGDIRACVLLTSGKVYCWGNALGGLLGNYRYLGSKGRPSEIPSAAGATNLAVGYSHACVVHPEMGVGCWGYNEFGQLGRGTTYVVTPTVAVAGGFTSVDVGAWYTCGIRHGDEVWCWGSNRYGQLGRGVRSGYGAPAPVEGLRAKSVHLGSGHACALTDGGAVFCWGDNQYGQVAGTSSGACAQLDEGANADLSQTVCRPRRIEGLGPVVELAVTSAHACVRQRDGRVSCWGRNTDGKVTAAPGAGTSVRTPVEVPEAQGALSLLLAWDTSCALLADELRCWGKTAGFGLPQTMPLPEPMVTGAAGAANGHLLSRSGRLYAIGYNADGQLGLGDVASRDSLTLVPTLERITAISTYLGHSCALGSNAEVYCWGGGSFAKHGQGLINPAPSPAPVDLGGRRAVSVSAGRETSCAVTEEGDVMCFGINEWGNVLARDPQYEVVLPVENLRGGPRTSWPSLEP